MKKRNLITMSKRNNGITLIALIITIIILLILAIITIREIMGKGIIQHAYKAVQQYQLGELKESARIIVSDRKISKESGKEIPSLKEDLEKIEGAEVEEVLDDLYYVTKGKNTITVYDNGDIISQKINVWDGASSKIPEIKEFNWYIYNPEQLKFLADFVNNGNALTEDQRKMVVEQGYDENSIRMSTDVTVYLMEDIDLGARQKEGKLVTGEKWTPIGTTSANTLLGTFEGNYHTIRGAYVNVEGNFAGIFGNSNSIQNLTIKDSYIEATGDNVGGIVGAFRTGTLTNCHNLNTSVIGSNKVGGIVGQGEGDIIDCTNNGSIEAQVNYVGGIVGVNRKCEIKNCQNNGKVKARWVSDGTATAGGISGFSATPTRLYYCINNATVSSRDHTGGIVGVLQGTVENCYNRGIIESSSAPGGIIGEAGTNADTIVRGCFNRGAIVYGSYDYIVDYGKGGVVGRVADSNKSTTITNNYNIGTIEVKGNEKNIGGIVGELGHAITAHNNYYIEGTPNPESNAIGESKTSEEMKREDFLELLNEGLEEKIWEIREGENDGYPIQIKQDAN